MAGEYGYGEVEESAGEMAIVMVIKIPIPKIIRGSLRNLQLVKDAINIAY